MTTRTNRLRKGTIVSLATILLATSVGAYGTFAYFNDTETSTANLFSAGTLDLALTTAEPGGVDAFVEAGNFAPGDVVSGVLTLENQGTIYTGDAEGHTVNLNISTALTATDADGVSTDMDRYLELTTLTYGTTDLLAQMSDENGNGLLDLGDMAQTDFTGLSDPGSAGKDLTVEVSFHPSANNDLQGDSINAAFTFVLAQS